MLVEPLNSRHERAAFTCGNARLDRYLREAALQAKEKALTAPFVAVRPDEPARVLGYYTLSACTISGVVIPDALRKRR
ncbi:MAG TPA: GNAT family N-acetyltransferase, partial [Candidatus Baltobacteraceae bacterium]|nr:GNAT family N-acetyltransferase [Candidatus Baltobacteraceae bacterium]